jgi:hypothetical protein
MIKREAKTIYPDAKPYARQANWEKAITPDGTWQPRRTDVGWTFTGLMSGRREGQP